LARGLSALRPTPRRAVSGAFALFAGVLVAAGMAGGTYAFLNSQASIPAVTVKSGSLALTVQYGATTAGTTTAIPTTAWATMLPGDIVGQQFTLASTGTAGSTLTAKLSATSAWNIRMAFGTCPAGQLSSAPLTTTAVAAGTVAGGANSTVCVQATLPASAAAGVSGTTAAFSIILDSTQVPS
jgi:predicted ribosomally synthesized peptide with SipW-like signal peptide